MPATLQEIYDRSGEILTALDSVLLALRWLTRLIMALLVINILKLAANVVIDWHVTKLLKRANDILDLAEKHGGMTDSKAKEVKENTVRAARAVVAEVKQVAKKLEISVPPKVAEEIARTAPGGGGGGSQSGTNLGTLPPA